MFVHTVYFWVNPGVGQEAVAAMARDCRELLGKMPMVKHLWAGVPAGTQRPVVDNSYALGLTVILDDSTGHDAYQAHPQHKEFIARHKQHWSRIQVYDFV